MIVYRSSNDNEQLCEYDGGGLLLTRHDFGLVWVNMLFETCFRVSTNLLYRTGMHRTMESYPTEYQT